MVVVVMIDNRATHNFISQSLVEDLGLKVDETRNFCSDTWAWKSNKWTRRCNEVTLDFRIVVIVENFFIFELWWSDIFLGMQLLEKLGTILTNWKLQLMQFQVGDKMVKLKRGCIVGMIQNND